MCHKLGAKVMGKKTVCQGGCFFEGKNEGILTLESRCFVKQKSA